ncbi:MAG: S9 family peptidase, partial [Bacteroidota bacterium]|nr:S9 family peptidase [Bacteroidota bacterium]
MKVLKLLIIATILFSINLNTGWSQSGKKSITIDGVMKEYRFFARSVNGLRSMNDGEHYTTLEGRGKYIVKYRYSDGELIDTLLNIKALGIEDFQVTENYEFSNDEKKILLYNNRERIYRRSFTANYYVYDFESKKLEALSETGKQQLATFSPDGSMIAFVRKNNIFMKFLKTGKKLAITTDGELNQIINGAPDWVYEEEFEFNKAFEWSPDSRSIAFMRFDESNVAEFGMTMFAGEVPTIEENKLYPEHRAWKYPKAGDDNSIVSVHVYHLASLRTEKMDVGRETDQYIPRIRWTKDPSQLCIFRLNRLQNKLELLFANNQSGESKIIYTDENKYYIDESYFDDLVFLDDKKHFIISNESDGYNHIYLYDLSGKLIRQITKGKWDVTNFYGFNQEKELFYFEAAAESPLQREIYSIRMNGRRMKKLSKKDGTNRAAFSKGFQYFINTYSSAKTPTLVTLNKANGKGIRVLENNSKYIEMLKEYKFNTKEFFSFKTSEGVELNASMIKPPNFDEGKKSPVLMTQYSGPNSQTVRDSWDIGWEQIMAGLGYIIISVDGRGTGARGEEFRKMTYLQLGKYETMDQIESAKYLQRLAYVDGGRIGIWGWSFGGFISTLCLEKGDGVFAAGVAVAPVTNWRYYDNIYTERFMRTPQENPDGYDDNSPLFF